MAFEIGTATSAADLYDKLIAFLTTNVDLVAASQQWAVVWNTPGPLENPTDIVVRGPGLSGQDQVYVGMRLHEDVLADAYWIEIAGMTGVIPAGVNYTDHVNVSPHYVRMFLDGGTMSYWFVANGRRFMVAVKISTVFEAMYAGLFLPYATPIEYPYPLFIGGSAGPYSDTGDVDNWREEHDQHTHYLWPLQANALMLDPAGEWLTFDTFDDNNGPNVCRIAPLDTAGDFFTSTSNGINDNYEPGFILARTMGAYGGSQVLVPSTIVQVPPATSQTFGVLDGAYRCQGVNNAAENLITVDLVDHLVLQNVYRSTFADYWAMALE